MSENHEQDMGSVGLERFGAVAQLTLSRPHALNSLTWEMYKQFDEHLVALAADPGIHVLVIRGDGDRALAAGTDIRQFQGFTGQDGLRYEERIDQMMDRLVNFPKPTIAAVHGYAVGGGMMIATACDLRYGTSKARFGAPMARTLGNCLSLKSHQRLVRELGPMRTKELIYTSRLLSAEEALSIGFLTGLMDEEGFFQNVLEIADRMSKNAPLTVRSTKEAICRLNQFQGATIPTNAFDDIVSNVYGSADFAEGVKAYLEKRPPQWQGK